MSILLDGARLAQSVRADLARRVAGQSRAPGLAVVLVGDNPASRVYVRNKTRACQETGVRSELVELPDSVSEAALRERIAVLNAREDIDGILVQLPLPKHIAAQNVIDAVTPDKDVDGLHTHNLGALLAGTPRILPCTPAGVMHLIEQSGVALRGARAAVVGASSVVGKPLALMLVHAGATVTLCNSKTLDLGEVTRRAGILVSAVGRANLITADMVQPGAVVIDVGINRTPEGRLTGDVDFAGVSPVASHITPVPGGVGPMTVAMLVANTVAAFERRAARGA